MPYGTINADLMTTSDGVSSSGLYGFKNRIINGAMVISQRGTGSTSVQTSTTFASCDRWGSYGSQNSKYTIQQTPSTTETGYATRVAAGFTNYLACTSSSAYTVAASDYFMINQALEGFTFADFAFGTSAAKTVTISFWAYSSLTGTFGGAFGNYAGSRSYPFTYTISNANTWTQISVTIAGDTAGTWVGASNNGAAILYFGLGVGSTYSGTAGAWASANYVSATGATSVVGTNGATFYITGVQLEKGSTATSFDYRPYGTELQLCQRYYEISEAVNGIVASCYDTTTVYGAFYWKVTKRVAPTCTVNTASNWTIWTKNTSFTGSSSAVTNSKINQLQFQISTTGLTSGYSSHCDNNNTYAFTASAEL